jgi:hypothetical protein
MDISYRRTPPSLLERALARLLKRWLIPTAHVHRLDLVHDLEVRQA